MTLPPNRCAPGHALGSAGGEIRAGHAHTGAATAQSLCVQAHPPVCIYEASKAIAICVVPVRVCVCVCVCATLMA